jgi:hypothetical protein
MRSLVDRALPWNSAAREGIETMLGGDVGSGKPILRDYVKPALRRQRSVAETSGREGTNPSSRLATKIEKRRQIDRAIHTCDG